MTRKPLNPRQVEVLQWISDACPTGSGRTSRRVDGEEGGALPAGLTQ